MKTLQLPILLFFALFLTTLAWPGGQQGQHRGVGGYQGNQGNQKQFHDAGTGQNARMHGGYGGGEGLEGGRKYRSNLYSDDDVYGYDATYPNGEASFINYKSKDARGRRGQEFARTSKAYSRQGGGRGGAEYGYGQQQRSLGNGHGSSGHGGSGYGGSGHGGGVHGGGGRGGGGHGGKGW